MPSVIEKPGAFDAYNLEEMQTLLKRYGFDDGDPLTNWLNAAMHDLENEIDWPWLQAPLVTLEEEPGTNTITLPEEALKIFFIRDVETKRKLDWMNRHKFAREIEDPTQTGNPELYVLINTNLVQIYPVPTTTRKYEIFYQAMTGNLVNPTDVPVTGQNIWPANTSYLIVLRAAALALMAENEEERAKTAQEQYDKELQRLRQKFDDQQLDEPQTVEDVMGYGESQSVRGRW